MDKSLDNDNRWFSTFVPLSLAIHTCLICLVIVYANQY